jgi:hypothetical protein
MDSHSISTTVSDPLNESGDVLIHPTTGTDAPDGERLSDFFERAGESVLDQFREDQPIRIGESSVTDGGKLSYETIVHVPIQTAPGVPTTADNIQPATRTALVKADRESVQSVAMPAPLPPEDEPLDVDAIARTLIEDLRQYPPAHMKQFRLIDPDESWIDRLRSHLD